MAALGRFHFTTLLLVLTVAAQLVLAFFLKPVNPAFDVLPPVPTEKALAASAFGDRQLLYRSLVLDMQNFGDTGGHWTPLKDYGMPKVVRWLEALDELDIDAAHHMVLATKYFGQTQNKPELLPLVEYLSRHVAANPRRSWPYLMDAIFLTQMRLQNRELSVRLADQMGSYDFPDMGPTAFEMPALIRFRIGRYADAVTQMTAIRERLRARVEPAEIDFMDEFIGKVAAMPDNPEAPLVPYK